MPMCTPSFRARLNESKLASKASTAPSVIPRDPTTKYGAFEIDSQPEDKIKSSLLNTPTSTSKSRQEDSLNIKSEEQISDSMSSIMVVDDSDDEDDVPPLM